MRIAPRIREDYREVNERIRKDSREVRDGYASSRIEFARIRKHSRPVNDSSPSLICVGTGHGWVTPLRVLRGVACVVVPKRPLAMVSGGEGGIG